MTTLTMMRTECCGTYKQCGKRCSICPNRPENREAVLRYKRECVTGLGCQLACEQECGMKHPSSTMNAALAASDPCLSY